MMRDCMSVYRIPNLPRSRGRGRGLSAGIQEGMHIIASPSLPHTRAHKHMFAHAVSGSISPRLVQRPLSHSRLAELRFPAKKKGGSRWLSHRNDWLGLGPIGRVATAPYAPYRHSGPAEAIGRIGTDRFDDARPHRSSIADERTRQKRQRGRAASRLHAAVPCAMSAHWYLTGAPPSSSYGTLAASTAWYPAMNSCRAHEQPRT
jgi:hypothetical protein